jgi:hypothetical protein
MRILVAALLCGCGTLAPPGVGDVDLPASGMGVFTLLTADPADPISAPFVLTDVVDIEEPSTLVHGTTVALWASIKRNGVQQIEHADLYDRLQEGFLPLGFPLSPSETWENGAIHSPSMLDGPPYVMFYAANDAIGWAVANDAAAHNFIKAPGPAFAADTEGGPVSSPAAVRVGDKIRVYYLAAGAIWAAEGSRADVEAGLPTTWTKLPGPLIRQTDVPFLSVLEHLQARAPFTPAGRQRFDLYMSGPIIDPKLKIHTVAGASSFDGLDFTVVKTPLLPKGEAGTSPTPAIYGPKQVLFFSRRFGSYDAIAAAITPP